MERDGLPAGEGAGRVGIPVDLARRRTLEGKVEPVVGDVEAAYQSELVDHPGAPFRPQEGFVSRDLELDVRSHVHVEGERTRRDVDLMLDGGVVLVLPGELRAVKRRLLAQASPHGRVAVRRVSQDQLEIIVRAVDHRAKPIGAAGLVRDHGLIVPVHGRRRELRRVFRHELVDEEIEVAALRRHRERPVLGDGPLDQKRTVEDVDVDQAVQTVGLRIAEPDIDDAAHLASEPRREISGVEVDLVQQSRLHEARQTAEVIEAIHRGAFELHLGVGGRRAANDDVGLGRASDAGHVFDGPQRIATGSGHPYELLAGEAPFRDLAGRRLDGGRRAEFQSRPLVRPTARVHAVGDRSQLAGGDVLVDSKRRPSGRGERDVKSPRRKRLEMKRARRIGDCRAGDLTVVGDERDPHARDDSLLTARQHATFELARRRRGGGFRGQLEHVPVFDSRGDGAIPAQGRREHEPSGGLDCRLVEPIACRRGDADVSDLPRGVDRHLEIDVRLLARWPWRRRDRRPRRTSAAWVASGR